MGMELIRSKTAVFKPGKVALPVGAERPERPVLSGGAGGYDPATACWMMILSWAIYHPYGGKGARSQFLDEEGLEELFVDLWRVVLGADMVPELPFSLSALPEKLHRSYL